MVDVGILVRVQRPRICLLLFAPSFSSAVPVYTILVMLSTLLGVDLRLEGTFFFLTQMDRVAGNNDADVELIKSFFAVFRTAWPCLVSSVVGIVSCIGAGAKSSALWLMFVELSWTAQKIVSQIRLQNKIPHLLEVLQCCTTYIRSDRRALDPQRSCFTLNMYVGTWYKPAMVQTSTSPQSAVPTS